MKNAFVSIVGRPNVGKSSLLNCLVGEKIAIVSKKPQTTRNRILGVLTKDDTQLVFVDTPGVHKVKNKLDSYMHKSILKAINDVDIVVLVVDCIIGIGLPEEELIKRTKNLGIPIIVAINKIDLLKNKETVLEVMDTLSKKFGIDEIVPISAINEDGVDCLCDKIIEYSVEGVHFFPDDTLTDQPEKVIVAEILREKFLMCTEKEIPHGIFIEIESMKYESDNSKVIIDANVYCEKESHKGIIIGKDGSMIKKIKSFAKRDIKNFLDCQVKINIWVKVKQGWRNKDNLLRNFGYDQKQLDK